MGAADVVEPVTWQAFRLHVIEGWSGKEAARWLGMKVATVFVFSSRLRKKLTDEIRRLEGRKANHRDTEAQ